MWREGRRARITFVTRGPAGERFELAAALAESLLGEELMWRWVGEIDLEPVRPFQGVLDFLSGRPPRVPLRKLAAEVDRVAAQVRAALPEVPWSDTNTGDDGLADTVLPRPATLPAERTCS